MHYKHTESTIVPDYLLAAMDEDQRQGRIQLREGEIWLQIGQEAELRKVDLFTGLIFMDRDQSSISVTTVNLTYFRNLAWGQQTLPEILV